MEAVPSFFQRTAALEAVSSYTGMQTCVVASICGGKNNEAWEDCYKQHLKLPYGLGKRADFFNYWNNMPYLCFHIF